MAATTEQEQQKAVRTRNAIRQACRTDLYALCALLGYLDVTEDVHGPIIDRLQKFMGGSDVERPDGTFEYIPACPVYQLQGARREIFLDPRGHLKTTVITIAHSIQWVLNYPDIRILISTAVTEQANAILKEIKEHFQFNEHFRTVFPEFCPPDTRAADWGTQDRFTVPCRRKHRKEPTCWTTSVGKVIAGWHPDVIKCSDMVDKENVKTPGGIAEVISHFGHLNPLLERYDARDGFPASTGWITVEGTRYDFGDLYGHLMKSDSWKANALVRGAIKPDGTSLWPSRFPLVELEKIRTDPSVGDWIFSAQYLNKCLPPEGGLCDPKGLPFVPAHVISGLMPQLRVHCTIDLAGMEPSTRGDWTVLTVAGFDRDGRMYVIECLCDHFSPDDVIEQVFLLHARYPQMIDFRVEKEAHARVLLPFLRREMGKRQRFPSIWPIKRDNRTSKQQRILGLRPWLKQGLIRFSDAIPFAIRQEILDEVAQFPSQSSGVHDDILDTLADMLQSRDGGVTDDVVPDGPDMKLAMFGRERPRDRFLGFGANGAPEWLLSGPDWHAHEHSPTGVIQ